MLFHSFSPNFVEIGQYLAELGGVLCARKKPHSARKKTHSARKKTHCVQEISRSSSSNEPLYYIDYSLLMPFWHLFKPLYLSHLWADFAEIWTECSLLHCARKKHFPRKKKHFPRGKKHFAREIKWLKTAVHFQMNHVVWLKTAV